MAHVLDARGLACPLPILRTRRELKNLSAGDVLEVLATDPGALEDFPAFCRMTGHALETTREENGVYVIRIRKTA
jgi:tRNA 2-thiouridine synthesizing protein A